MTVRWLTAFIDRPVGAFDDAVAFWAAVTSSTVSPPRGSSDEFATLIPPDGDAHLRVQRVADGPGGSHLDLHVDDVERFASHAVDAGAEVAEFDGHAVMRSPAGLAWCVVPHHGEAERPTPRPAGEGAALHLVDQLCLDVPAETFDAECAFWSRVTGWDGHASSLRPEFHVLHRPGWSPLRLLLQRCAEGRRPGAHLDVASTDVASVVAHHVQLGARVVEGFEHWTVMVDPSDIAYCITARSPVATPSA